MNKMIKVYILSGVILLGVFVRLGISYAQSGPGFQAVKISKSQNVSLLWQKKVTVRVNDIQSTDAINIRTKNVNSINVKILSTADREVTLSDGKKIIMPGNGPSVSENALTLSESELLFARPQGTGKILLDIELPEATDVEVYSNGERIVKTTTLYSPITIKNGVVSKGEETTAKANMRLMFPQLLTRNPKDDVEIGTNKFTVDFSKLQLTKSVEFTNNTGPIKAVIDINEQGLVENVAVIEPMNSQDVSQKIRQWEFVPYLKDGQPVKVSTVFMKE